ncbi:MAG: hypothetical protein MJK12_11705 [Colwellia sp.]|nr:hypothetical protein [Colwellia sp.]
MSEQLVTLLAFVVAIILSFLILRAFVLWYWRVGEMVDSLNEINKNISLIKEKEQ